MIDRVGEYPDKETTISITKNFPSATSQDEIIDHFESLTVPRILRGYNTASEHFYSKDLTHLYEIAREIEHFVDSAEHKLIMQTTCAPKFKKQCPLNWENLSSIPDTVDRWCTLCRKRVHRTDDPKELYALAKEGKCVAVLYENASLLGHLDIEYLKEQVYHLTDQKL